MIFLKPNIQEQMKQHVGKQLAILVVLLELLIRLKLAQSEKLIQVKFPSKARTTNDNLK